MSWYGGYEFILRCLIDVIWKSFGILVSPFVRMGLVKDYLMQLDLDLEKIGVQ